MGVKAWKVLVCPRQNYHTAAMRKRVQIAVAVLLVAIVVIIVWQVLGVREPSYGGKPLSQWLADLDLGSSDSPDKAAQAVRLIGTNSFPWLTEMLRVTDPIWKQAVIAVNAKQSIIRLPVTPASMVRARAVDGYNALGSGAKDNVPKLVQMMDSETSPQVRSCVAAALGAIGPGAKAAIPALLKAADDKNAEVCKHARLALANIQMWIPDDHKF
jgi:hypothetical protein